MTRRPALLLVLLAACKTAGGTPQQTLHGFLHDSALGNLSAAYQRLHPDFRKRCDLACFGRMLDSQPGQSRQLLDELRAGEPTVVYSAELKLESGLVLRLEKEPLASTSKGPATFGFVDNPLDFYPQDTPSRTLRSFVQAFGAKRFDVLTRFVPKSFQNKLTPELLRERFASEPRIVAQVEALRKHLDEPVTIDGNTARLPLGPEQEATLLLQDGRWRVQKLE